MPFGASWQPPRKCLENVLVLGLALEKCPENVKKCPSDIFQTFFLTFSEMESQKGARARPLLGGGRRPPPLDLQKNVKRMYGKGLGDIFSTFSAHFSSASPSTRTFSKHFLGHFSGRLPGSPKRHFETFFDIFEGAVPKLPRTVIYIFWTS